MGLDFLTLTIGTTMAERLMPLGRVWEPGYGRAGFARSEQRTVNEWRCWRRWEPHQTSTFFPDGYESWEWSGHDAHFVARDIGPLLLERPRDHRARRVDVAFDFMCDEGHDARQVLAELEPHARASGIECGMSGMGQVYTCYVGSREHSDRYIRVYRRDFKETPSIRWTPDGEPLKYAAEMRVELVMRDDLAEAFFPLWLADRDAGYAAAAAHVQQMTGWAPITPGPIPEPVKPQADPDLTQQLFTFMHQHGRQLALWERLGVPFDLLVRTAVDGMSKATRWRLERDCRRANAVDLVAVVREVEGLLRLRARGALGSAGGE